MCVFKRRQSQRPPVDENAADDITPNDEAASTADSEATSSTDPPFPARFGREDRVALAKFAAIVVPIALSFLLIGVSVAALVNSERNEDDIARLERENTVLRLRVDHLTDTLNETRNPSTSADNVDSVTPAIHVLLDRFIETFADALTGNDEGENDDRQRVKGLMRFLADILSAPIERR